MSTTPISRKAGVNPCPLTLAGLLAKVEADKSQPERLKEDIASALRTIGRAIDCPVGEAPAEPAYIRSRLQGFGPESLGIKESTWANVRSLYKRALVIAGVEDSEPKRVPLTPEWEDALALVTGEDLEYDRWRICAFGRWCSATGIRPNTVTEATLEAYRNHLSHRELTRSPQVTHRELCIAWNRVVDAVPQWPQQRVQVPNYRQTYSLRWEDFPQSLREEVDRYLAYLRNDDLFDGCPHPFRPASLKARRDTLRTWLSAIVINGRDVKTLTSLTDAVQLDAFKRALRFFIGRGAGDNLELAKRHADAIIALAQHWLKVDEKHVAAMKEMRDRLKRDDESPAIGEKSRERLKQFHDPQQVQALLILPRRLIARMPKDRAPTPSEALRFQIAVAIEITIRTLFRLNNLSAIEIGRHLTWAGKGKRRTMHLSIPADEVKNGVELHRVIAPESAEMIEEYIERYRPVLLKAPSKHLFPGEKGGGKQKGWLSKQMSDCIRRETGIVMHTHLFRHFGVILLLNAYPGGDGIARLLLGHKSTASLKFYTDGSEAKAAFRHYDQHIAGLRQNWRDGVGHSENQQKSKGRGNSK